MSSAACTEFKAHAFLQNKCRDCSKTEDEHPKNEHAAAFEQLDSAGVLKDDCAHYTPHAWIYDRCRDCGGNEESHASSSMEAGDKPNDPNKRIGANSMNFRTMVLGSSTKHTPSQSMEIKHLDIHDSAKLSSPPNQPLSPGQIRASTAEDSMRQAVAKMTVFENEFDKISAADAAKLEAKEITQSEYDASIENLKKAFAAKEAEMRVEVEAARADIEEANLMRQREIEEAAALQVAEAQEATRVAVEEAQESERKRVEAESQLQAAKDEISAKEQIIVAASSRELDDAEEQPAAVASVPAPILNTVAAQDSAVHLSDVLKSVEKLFQTGRNVVRYQAGRPATFSAVFIRELSKGDDLKSQYSLCWTKANDREVHLSRCIAFSEITAVVLGKQTSVFLQDSAANASAACCVSFIARGKRSLHLQFGNLRDADTWAYGIASLMKEYGNKPDVKLPGQYIEPGSEREKDFDFTQPEEDDGAKPVSQTDIDSIASLNQPIKYKIELACRCANLPSVHQNTIVCLVDRNERTNKLEYLNQTEKASGTTDPTFKKKFPLTFVDTSAKTLRFNVYDVPAGSKNIEDEYRLGSAIVSISALVEKPGADFVYSLSHKHPKRQEKLTAALSTLTVSCASKVQLGSQQTEEQRAAKAQLQALEKMLVQADTFTYHMEGVNAQSVTIFYTPGVPPATVAGTTVASDPDRFDLGNLNWATIGAKPQSLSLRTVVDLFVGKKHKVFGQECADENCFSLVSKTGVRLDLEAKNKAQRDSWVQALITFLKAASAQGQRDRAARSATASTPTSSSGSPALPVVSPSPSSTSEQ